MKEISDVTFCVVDTGLFLPLAHCLAEQAKRVLYYNPDRRSWPSLRQRCIGDGFEDIEAITDIFDHLKEIDCAVFPDIGNGPLQKHLLEDCKIPVWGSMDGDDLELDRELLMDCLKEWNLAVPPHTVCVGWSALCEELRDAKDKYIKISRFRGDMETYHFRSWALDENWIYWLANNFGPIKEQVRFLVFDEIKTDIELGGDTYNVAGEWPSLMLNGVEGKDKSYLAAVTPREEMPEAIQAILAVVGPHLGQRNYRNQISFEIRHTKDDFFYTDATQRGGMPSSASQQVLWKNFPEIILAGAHGELLEPEHDDQFSMETMITSKTGLETWDDVEIPAELEGHARFSFCCQVDGKYCFPPDELLGNFRGWLISTGSSPREVLEKQKGLADLLPDGLNADVEALAPIIDEIEKMEKEGIHFTDEKMPKPAEVL